MRAHGIARTYSGSIRVLLWTVSALCLPQRPEVVEPNVPRCFHRDLFVDLAMNLVADGLVVDHLSLAWRHSLHVARRHAVLQVERSRVQIGRGRVDLGPA